MPGLLVTEVPGGGEFEVWYPDHNPAKVTRLPSGYDKDGVWLLSKGLEDVHCKTPYHHYPCYVLGILHIWQL